MTADERLEEAREVMRKRLAKKINYLNRLGDWIYDHAEPDVRDYLWQGHRGDEVKISEGLDLTALLEVVLDAMKEVKP